MTDRHLSLRDPSLQTASLAIPLAKKSKSVPQLSAQRILQISAALVGSDVNSSEALRSLGAELARSNNLQEAFKALPAHQQGFLRKKIGEKPLDELLAMSREPSEAVFHHNLLQFAHRLKDNSNLEQAAAVLTILGEASFFAVPENIQSQAKQTLDAIAGKGAIGPRVGYLLERVAEDSTDLKTFSPIVLASLAGNLAGAGTLAKLLSLGGESWYSRGIGARATAFMAGYGAEFLTFGLAGRAFNPHPGPLADDLWRSAITIGAFKGTHFLGNQLFLKTHGLNKFGFPERLPGFARFHQIAVPQFTMFTGMLAAHRLEEMTDLRKPTDNATTVTDTLFSMLTLGLGMHNVNRALGPGWRSLQLELGARAEAGGRLANAPQARLGEWVKSWVPDFEIHPGQAFAAEGPMFPNTMAMIGNLEGGVLQSNSKGDIKISTINSSAVATGGEPASSGKKDVIPARRRLHTVRPAISDQFKVVTYNMGYASGETNNTTQKITRDQVIANLDQMVEGLRAMNPDVVLLQEVDFASARSHKVNQLDYLAQGLGMSFVSKLKTWDVSYLPFPGLKPSGWMGRVVSGQAVLSRHPITGEKIHHFSKPPSNPFWYNWFYMDRMAQQVSLDWNSTPVSVWNVHLEPFDAKHRMTQTKLLAEWVKADPNPHKIVAGDFNSSNLFIPKEFTVAQADELMKITGRDRYKAWIHAGRPTDHQTIRQAQDIAQASLLEFLGSTGFRNAEPTHPDKALSFFSWGDGPFEKLDHVTHSPSFRSLRAETEPLLTASDHLPFWAILESKDGGRAGNVISISESGEGSPPPAPSAARRAVGSNRARRILTNLMIDQAMFFMGAGGLGGFGVSGGGGEGNGPKSGKTDPNGPDSSKYIAPKSHEIQQIEREFGPKLLEELFGPEKDIAAKHLASLFVNRPKLRENHSAIHFSEADLKARKKLLRNLMGLSHSDKVAHEENLGKTRVQTGLFHEGMALFIAFNDHNKAALDALEKPPPPPESSNAIVLSRPAGELARADRRPPPSGVPQIRISGEAQTLMPNFHGQFVLGRNQFFGDSTVSMQHLVMSWRMGGWGIMDGQSTFGTYYFNKAKGNWEGLRKDQYHPVVDGELFHVGNTYYRANVEGTEVDFQPTRLPMGIPENPVKRYTSITVGNDSYRVELYATNWGTEKGHLRLGNTLFQSDKGQWHISDVGVPTGIELNGSVLPKSFDLADPSQINPWIKTPVKKGDKIKFGNNLYIVDPTESGGLTLFQTSVWADGPPPSSQAAVSVAPRPAPPPAAPIDMTPPLITPGLIKMNGARLLYLGNTEKALGQKAEFGGHLAWTVTLETKHLIRSGKEWVVVEYDEVNEGFRIKNSELGNGEVFILKESGQKVPLGKDRMDVAAPGDTLIVKGYHFKLQP